MKHAATNAAPVFGPCDVRWLIFPILRGPIGLCGSFCAPSGQFWPQARSLKMQESETNRLPQVGETVPIRVVGHLQGVVMYVNDDGTIVVDPCYVYAKWIDKPNPCWLGLTAKSDPNEDSEAPKTALGTQIEFQRFDGDDVIAGTVVGRKGDQATVRVQEQTVSTTTTERIPASTATVEWDEEFESWIEIR